MGRDAGRLVVSTGAAVLEGDITASAFKGARQVEKGDARLDGYAQSHNAAAHAAQLILGSYTAGYNGDAKLGPVGVFHNLAPTVDRIVFEDGPGELKDALRLDSKLLNSFGLGAVTALARQDIKVGGALTVEPGGRIALHATRVEVDADLTARGGTIALGNVLNGFLPTGEAVWAALPPVEGMAAGVVVAKGVKLDARGLWSNLQLDPGNGRGLPYLDGGAVDVRSSGAVTLAAGSLVDVSSGGAMLSNGKTRGGRGGDVVLLADEASGTTSVNGQLTMDGEIRGYGVAGGGTLRVSSGTGVMLGGGVPGSDGVLGRGTAAPTDLILLQDYLVHAGDVLPVDYGYDRTRVKPGESLLPQAAE